MIRRAARAHGFLDPFGLFLRLSRFGQPSEVLAPTELLRATAVLHARGLLNAQVIQHNLDWIWPYWVNRQFDPRSGSFVPRAFSLTHINLTHRNWTAVGLPDSDETPLVDPAGLVTPFWDSWSLDAWVLPEHGEALIPARLEQIAQKLVYDGGLAVVTSSERAGLVLESRVEVTRESGQPVCRILWTARAARPARLVVSVRPYNPEGVSLVHDIAELRQRPGWKVNHRQEVWFDEPPANMLLSNFHQGDVFHLLNSAASSTSRQVHCPTEMATAAAVFPMVDGLSKSVEVRVPLSVGLKTLTRSVSQANQSSWARCLEPAPRLRIADAKLAGLFESSLRTILLHSATDVYAGPFIYKRFWFRDAAFITYALMICGFHDRAERIIDGFASRQTLSGYFESQEGEWDSNGQVIWVMERFCALTGKYPKPAWLKMIDRGARWMIRKRLPEDSSQPFAGLMPSGFSAEHFGPNNYYYWDDFWTVAGLRAAGCVYEMSGDSVNREIAENHADSLMGCIIRSLSGAEARIRRPAMPSSPLRRLDSASVGCLVAGYPLQLWTPGDLRLVDTARYLMDHCLVRDGFFHDMSHSGINPYLTLHIAQVLLRSGDSDYLRLLKAIGSLASPTGQWPEAIHPDTLGGCMGDGQHVWAAAEWVLMIRNCFVREELAGRKLILCSGVPLEWVSEAERAELGPVATSFGQISIRVVRRGVSWTVAWEAAWHGDPPEIEVCAPGGRVVLPLAGSHEVTVILGEGR